MKELSNILKTQNEFFKSGKTLNYDFRINALKKLKKTILKNEQLITEALKKDLNKPPVEALTNETMMATDDINYTIKKLRKWMKPERKRGVLFNFPSKNYIVKEPYGTCLIIGPWNYPVQLTLVPLVGAIAAGNCGIIKPSEISPNSSAVVAKIINEAFDSSYIYAAEGNTAVSSFLLDQEFDKIFFTGSPQIGKIVMEKAAKHLTPVTLELGGKSPCIIDRDIDLELTARRVLWGKIVNAGQTCIAPDYLLIHKNIKKKLIESIKKQLKAFFPDGIEASPDYGRIINENHFSRIIRYMKDGDILIGGEYKKETLFISPTFIEPFDLKRPVMADEIFGPVMPVIEFTDYQQVFDIINQNRNPLNLYIFSKNKKLIKQLSAIQAGMICVNNTLINAINNHLPFGGRGKSGMGNYHGKFSFDDFSHKKALVKSSLKFDLKMKYPPYKNGYAMIKKFMLR